jgi:hypothetical protein
VTSSLDSVFGKYRRPPAIKLTSFTVVGHRQLGPQLGLHQARSTEKDTGGLHNASCSSRGTSFDTLAVPIESDIVNLSHFLCVGSQTPQTIESAPSVQFGRTPPSNTMPVVSPEKLAALQRHSDDIRNVCIQFGPGYEAGIDKIVDLYIGPC